VRLHTDDEVYSITNKWLGPKGLTFPWPTTYIAVGVALGFWLLLLFVESFVGLRGGLVLGIGTAVAAIAAGHFIGGKAQPRNAL